MQAALLWNQDVLFCLLCWHESSLPVEQRDQARSYQPVSPRPYTVRWLRDENFHHISFDKCLRRAGRATLTQELTYTFHLIYIATKLFYCTKCFLSSKMDCTHTHKIGIACCFMDRVKLDCLKILKFEHLGRLPFIVATKSVCICHSSLAPYRVRSSFHLT